MENQKQLLSKNEQLTAYYERQERFETKMLQAKYKGRLLSDKETKQVMAKMDRQFQKNVRAK
jgi:hypothetical protein